MKKWIQSLIVISFCLASFLNLAKAEMRLDSKSKILLIQTLKGLQSDLRPVAHSRKYSDNDTIKVMNDVQRASLVYDVCFKLSFYAGKFDLIDELMELDSANRLNGEELGLYTTVRSGLLKCETYSQILRDDVRNYTPKFGISEITFLVGTQRAAYQTIEKMLSRLEQHP